MDILIKQRASCKASITRIDTWYGKNKDEQDKYAFKFRLDNLENQFNKYCEIQDRIESTSQDIGKETVDRETIEEKYYILRCKLQNSFDTLNLNQIPVSQANSQNIQGDTHIRLPFIEIPVFTGDSTKYSAFIDLFNALIVNNSKLSSKTEKFYYLKSYLRSEPLNLISQLPVNESNFDAALELLDARYNNKRQIVTAHFNKLSSCTVINKCTAQQLRTFTSESRAIVNSLLNLNITKEDLFDALIVHILKNKLDFTTKKSLEEKETDHNLITTDRFFDFLEKKCNVLENLIVQEQKTDHNLNSNRSHTFGVTTPHHNRVTLLSNQNLHTNQPSTSSLSNFDTPSQLTFNADYTSTPINLPVCSFCKNTGHKIYSCPKFGSMSVSERHKFVKVNRMCFGCLGSRHTLSNCISTGLCSICKKKHHVLLHLPMDSPRQNIALSSLERSSVGSSHTINQSNSLSASNSNDSTRTGIHNDSHYTTPVGYRNQTFHPKKEEIPPPSQPNLAMLNLNGSHVLLATATILIYPHMGPPVQARALLDPGSQNSFICSDLVKQLKCKTYNQPLWVSGIGNNKQNITSMTDLIFSSTRDNSLFFDATCAIVEQITQSLPQVFIDKRPLDLPPHLVASLADSNFGTPSQVHVLLGADIYYSLLKPGMHPLGKNFPTLIATHLGWVISGVVPPHCIVNKPRPLAFSQSFHVSLRESPQEAYVDTLLEKFWAQEEVTTAEQMSEDDIRAETIFIRSVQTLQDGRFQVDPPLIHDLAHKELGDSFVAAKHRFISLEKKLQKNPQMKEEYRKMLFEYIQLGHGQLVPLSLQTTLQDHKYFVPHLFVFKESSSSTKLRIVFDYSSKSSSLISLNDISLKGPRVQPELLDIVLRFRNFKYALTADISKMYRQIALNPKFRFLQNALWRDSPSDQFVCIQLDTVSFGQTSAPYLACRVLKEIALRNPQYPGVQDALLSQTYVDDVLTGANTVYELENLYHNLREILSQSGFDLHKFCSNSTELSNSYFPDSPSEKDLNLEDNPSKVLGIVWNPKNDMLQISSPSSLIDTCITKRRILSTVSQCFDPLGLINPVIVQGKLIMQHLWLLKLSWDEPITDPSLIKRWQTFIKSISLLSTLQIPRYTLLDKTVCYLELHGFCDSSSVAFGGCIYLRAVYVDGTASSRLIISKSRVAPLNKPLTIPKLELCAMTLLAKLYSRVKSILEQQLQISSFNLWSDSQIALSWIKSTPTRWSVFVCNRVTQIQQLTQSASWRHIRSHLNPADLLSRGQTLNFPSDFWFLGPSFLWETAHDTASHDTFSNVTNPPEENKKALIVVAPSPNQYLMLISRSSSFTKLVRSMAYVIKFTQILRNPNATLPSFSRQDLDLALSFLVRQVQENHFPKLILLLQRKQFPSDKRLLSLNLFIDHENIIRVGGRLSHADIPFQQKHPILLPSGSHFTTLVLQREHRRLGHSGPQNVLANVRLQFWPLDGLREIKRIINKCCMCHRFKAITAQQIMADLPKHRVTPSRPFQFVGVDFAGPFLAKSSCLKKAPLTKCYVALFVCFSSKAVHLELVSDLSTDAFIATLKRFISRRGHPTTIYSDNGTNFVGAKNQLKELSNFLIKNFSPIYDHLIISSIEWKFIPPRSPHWGGLWEISIRSVKTHLLKLLSNMKFTFEQFSTILAQIEAILNSRPLVPLSSDPGDLSPLTPGHFLIGAPLMSLPDKDVTLIPLNRLKFWQQCTYVQQHFWKRWSVDYLNQLQNRPKWTITSPDLTVGALVLVKDDDSPPLKWPLARITDVIPGKDGRVRSVQVRTASGTYVRPIVKIVPLPMTDPPTLQNP